MHRLGIVLAVASLFCGIRVVSAADQVSFLIFPPENMSKTAALAWIGESVCLSISDQLRMPALEVFGREDRLNFVEGADLPPNATLSRASMIHVSQHVGADKLVMGYFQGTEDSLRIALRVLDVKSLKLGGEIIANGPLAALPQMENELAWLLLSNSGLDGTYPREKFRERVRTVPNAAYAVFVQSLSSSDQTEQIDLLLKAVLIHPDFPEAQSQLGRYYYLQGDCSQTIRHLSKVGARRTSFLEDQFLVGNCHLKQNEFEQAIHAYATILAFTESAQALNNSAVASLLNGDSTLAGQSLVEARNLAKSDPTIALNLAIVRHLQGNEGAARSLLEELDRTHSDRGMVQYLLNLVLSAQGEHDKASDALAQAKRLGTDPEKLRAQDPKSWTRLFSSWDGRP